MRDTQRRRALALALALGATACERFVVIGRQHTAEPADAGAACESSADCIRPWGVYAADLGLPDCPPAPVLVVNTTADELDGDTGLADPALAGPTLSLAEALWIAANRPGPDTVLFDATVFPVDAPATILLSEQHQLPADPTPVCIDGRSRGVIVDWPPSPAVPLGFSRIGDGSSLIGLTFTNIRQPLEVAQGGTMSGCRLLNNAVAAVVLRGTFGPGNAVSGLFTGILLSGTTHVFGNFFGWDPAAWREASLTRGLGSAQGGAHTIEANVFASAQFPAITLIGYTGPTTIARNFFSEDSAHRPLPAVTRAIVVGETPTVVIGPDNVISFSDFGIEVQTNNSLVRVTQNTFGPAPVASVIATPVGILGGSPVVLSASATQVSGSCNLPGTIEVYGGSPDAGWTYLAQAQCGNTGAWTASVGVAPGTQVCANITYDGVRTSAFSEPVAGP